MTRQHRALPHSSASVFPVAAGRMPRARSLRGVLLVLILSGIGVAGMSTPAQAHNYLVSSTPAEGATLSELPETFDITTNDALLEVGADAGAFAFQVLDADGLYYGDGCVSVAGPTMTATPALGGPGPYTVRWQVLSADGHVVSGEYGFDWAPGVATEPSVGSASAPVCGQAAPEALVPSESPTPAEPATPSQSADPTESPGPSTAPESENVSSDDTLPTVLWIGGVVIALAVGVVVTLLITGRTRA